MLSVLRCNARYDIPIWFAWGFMLFVLRYLYLFVSILVSNKISISYIVSVNSRTTGGISGAWTVLLWFMISGCPFVFDLWYLVAPLIYDIWLLHWFMISGCSIDLWYLVAPLIYDIWLPLWFMISGCLFVFDLWYLVAPLIYDIWLPLCLWSMISGCLFVYD